MEDQKWWHRLFNVLYFVTLTIIILSAAGAAIVTIDDRYFAPEWLPLFHSGVFLNTALTGIISILILELIRKVSAYVVMGRKFFSFDFPKITLILFAVFLVTLAVAGVSKYTVEAHLENKWVTEQRAADTTKLQELEELLEVQREDARNCLLVEQAEALQKDKETCEARYRRVKMGYDSCMMYGWRTMCLQSNDYEVIDCSDEALQKPVEDFYTLCSAAGIRTLNEIEVIQENLDSNYR